MGSTTKKKVSEREKVALNSSSWQQFSLIGEKKQKIKLVKALSISILNANSIENYNFRSGCLGSMPLLSFSFNVDGFLLNLSNFTILYTFL